MGIAETIHCESDERIVAVYRPFIGGRIPAVTLSFVLYVGTFFLLAFFMSYGLPGAIAFCILLAIAVWYSLRIAITWYYTVLVVTDRRVVRILQRRLFDRSVSSIPASSIQDVTYRIRGIVATLLRIGSITIAGTIPGSHVEFRGVRNPGVVVAVINAIRKPSSVSSSPHA